MTQQQVLICLTKVFKAANIPNKTTFARSLTIFDGAMIIWINDDGTLTIDLTGHCLETQDARSLLRYLGSNPDISLYPQQGIETNPKKVNALSTMYKNLRVQQEQEQENKFRGEFEMWLNSNSDDTDEQI